MRGIRFRDALTAYLVGLAVAHLRLFSIWSVTAARLHFWITEERGDVPAPLDSYRTSESALKVYADALAEDNDRMRHALRLGIVQLMAESLREVGERIREWGARLAVMTVDVVRGLALAGLTTWAAICAAGIAILVMDGVTDTAMLPAAEGPPDAGVHRPARRHARPLLAMCVAESPRYVLRWSAHERAPRLILLTEVRSYWWEEQAVPIGYPACTPLPLRDCGAELYPRPTLTAGDELVASSIVIVLD